jgi:hypothetical protein
MKGIWISEYMLSIISSFNKNCLEVIRKKLRIKVHI